MGQASGSTGSGGSTGAGGLAGAAPMIGMGIQVIGAGLQIARSIDQKKKARDAERASKELLEQAKSRLDVNRMEGIQVPLEAYEMAGREVTAQQMQSLEGLREADARTLAAGVGKLGAAGAAATEGVRQNMAEAIYQRDKMIANEAARIDTVMGGISLEEVSGAQIAAKEREEAAAMALSGGIAGMGGAFDTLAKSQDLYSQRQGQMAAAQQYQQQTGQYQGMTPAQARMAMMGAGIGQQGFSNLAQGLTYAGRQVQQAPSSSIQAVGIQPLGGGIQPVTFP